MSDEPKPPAGPNPFSDQPQKPPVVADTNPYATPQMFVTDAPGYAWATTASEGLRRVSSGLAFVYYGIVVILFAVLFAIFMPMVVRGVDQLALIALGGMLVGRLLMIIGPFLCLAVPVETGAKPLIVTSVIFMTLNVIETVITVVGQLGGNAMPLPWEVSILSTICGLVATILFLLFLRRLSMYIGRPDLAQRAITVLVLNVIVISLALIIAVIAIAGSQNMRQMQDEFGAMFAVLGLGLLVLLIVWLIKYTGLLVALRKILVRS